MPLLQDGEPRERSHSKARQKEKKSHRERDGSKADRSRDDRRSDKRSDERRDAAKDGAVKADRGVSDSKLAPTRSPDDRCVSLLATMATALYRALGSSHDVWKILSVYI